VVYWKFVEISEVSGQIYSNIRPTHGKIINKPWDDINYFISNKQM